MAFELDILFSILILSLIRVLVVALDLQLRHVDQFPEEGSNPRALHCESHWATRGVLSFMFLADTPRRLSSSRWPAPTLLTLGLKELSPAALGFSPSTWPSARSPTRPCLSSIRDAPQLPILRAQYQGSAHFDPLNPSLPHGAGAPAEARVVLGRCDVEAGPREGSLLRSAVCKMGMHVC